MNSQDWVFRVRAVAAVTAMSFLVIGCGGSGGDSSSPVPAPPLPTVSLSANPPSVASGRASTLTWSSSDATSCVASGAWSGSKALSGSESTGTLTRSSEFSLSCTGSGGSASASATATVTGTPPVSGSCSDPNSKSIALVIDSAFASRAQTELAQLAVDVNKDLGVCVRTLPVNVGTTAVQIRTQLKDWYAGANLQGALLIGDVPSVQLGDYTLGGITYPPYVTDSFYEVLDDAFWKDPDGNGIYNRTADIEGNGQPDLRYDLETPERTRNIWTGRLMPPRALTFDARVNQLRAYLSRNHSYRTGGRTYEPSMVYFNSIGNNHFSFDGADIDQATNESDAVSFYSRLGLFTAPSTTGLTVVWNSDLGAQLAQWRWSMQFSKEYAYVTVHGATDLQQFSSSDLLTSADYQATPPKALLLDIDSCNNAMFEAANYLGGHALFAGETLAVRSFTAPVFIVGRPAAAFNRRLLAMGLTLGEIHRLSALPDIAVLLGDPTLRLRQPDVGPTLDVSPSQLDFADAAASSPVPFAPSRVFTVTNTGSRAITIDQNENSGYTSWNGIGTLNRSIPAGTGSVGIDPDFLADPADVVRFPITLAPRQSTDIRVYFVMRFANAKPGLYRWKATFSTDSPSAPTFTVYASQRLN